MNHPSPTSALACATRRRWMAGLATAGLLAAVAGALRAAPTDAPSNPAAPVDPAFAAAKPVIEARCFKCHGGEKTKSGLSLASGDLLRKGGLSGNPLEGDKPLLRAAIAYTHDEVRMPPTGQLPQAERDILNRWLNAGAPWPAGVKLAGKASADDDAKPTLEEGRRWWAYQPVAQVAVPKPQDAAFAAHPVDAFLAAKWEAAGLKPAPEADRAALIRRAAFDLTGLPPTPEEVAAFLADTAPDAWEKLIDRLLASPHYGEQQARQWMDVVRFAETNGYERDSAKPNMWRYRDWLIRAFSSDMPFDRFVLEQLAGDELPDASPSSRLATGYYRLCIWDDEPVDRAQARADELADITDTTGQAFLATTVGCARCHDHKKDPISQRDYYALTAFFNNIEGFSYRAGRHVPDPWLPVGAGAAMTESDRKARLDALDTQTDEVLAEFEKAWQAGDHPKEETGRVLLPDARAQGVTWRYAPQKADGWETPGFDDKNWKTGAGGFGRQGTPGSVVRTAWESREIVMRTRFNLTELPKSLVLSLHHDDDVEIYLNGFPIHQAKGYVVKYEDFQLPQEAVSQLVVGSNVLAVRCRQDFGGQYIDAGLSSGWATGRPGWLARTRMHGAQYLPAASWKRFGALERERAQVAAAPAVRNFEAQVVSERPGPAPVQHVLGRGSVHNPREEVAPNVPAVMRPPGSPGPAVPADKRRLALARWIADPANPMAAKVYANRIFQQHFGRGLAPTPGDFGKLGTKPSHPELLQYLGAALVREKGSTKAMHRLLMTSRAYRMSAAGPAGSDADNNLLARAPVRRLSAEEFRDAVLAASGQLNPNVGGPSVYAPMPAEVLAGASKPTEVWGTCTPEEAGRRSLYIFSKRSLRYPLLEVFDQPDTDQGCHARFGTLTPTQSLTTMNGEFMNGSAAAFAKRLMAEKPGDRAAQLRRGLFLALCRDPDAGTLARHLAFLQKLEAGGHSPERALACVCLAILNENAFIFKD